MQKDLAIILCTYNGQNYLQEQLDSYKSQNYKKWELFISDDNSTDATIDIIKKFKIANQNHKITLNINKNKLGFVNNFLNATKNISRNFDFYAFSDQDDIWCSKKLERAVDYLKTIRANTPALYCSRTTLYNNSNKKTGLSPLFSKPPSFSNALVQSIAGGNTMVFNQAAHNLISRAICDTVIISHDWFLYQLVTGAGGKVFYDPSPEILYRQHSDNLIGGNIGIFAKLFRIKKLLDNSFRSWNSKNIKVLKKNSILLSEENIIKLNLFEQARNKPIVGRLTGFYKAGIFRQSFSGQIALWIGAIFNKI
ncbi:glycosyltransferase family 2 protein [Rickettsia endosymbiont of Halotydeus destructor]|uniref:glycosyltransferase family 2 protein n=1 Tax=Rickettsia endosymbiont of Halotydeus destructor TaxID=2996754 RepID=UPI003BB0ED2E